VYAISGIVIDFTFLIEELIIVYKREGDNDRHHRDGFSLLLYTNVSLRPLFADVLLRLTAVACSFGTAT
jgi:hypothetical protein